MRVLFVTSVYPRDFSRSVYGIFQRMRMWLDAIKSLGYDLEILFLVPHGAAEGERAASALEADLLIHWGIDARVSICSLEPRSGGNLKKTIGSFLKFIFNRSHHPSFWPYSSDRQKAAFHNCMLRAPDIVFFQKIYSMGVANHSMLRGLRVFLDLDDVEHLRFAREISEPPYWKSKKTLYLEVPVLWNDERVAILRSEKAFVCSDVDQKYLKFTMRTDNVITIPNATGWVADAPLARGQNVLFLGNGLYGPNRVAATFLIEKIWPRVKVLCPGARLLIAGTGWDSFCSSRNGSDGIDFLGFVPNLDSLYRNTRLMCCPIRSGSGTRIKILEAANYGVPVVSTTIGAEGLDFKPDIEIIIRDDMKKLAQACTELLLDYKKASDIGISGRECVRRLYSRDAVIKKIESVIDGNDKLCK